ncbi:pyruvate dehydrogenase (acetyl-transferring) kinase isozyme 2, mitochondrial-like isoform X2 [Saccostrea echinata]|uniref:pyruvate dehydrogenase (acetyl-transferring) kinase isozyme 2, mitochondrial-like isoform X2 n=1 Tax=Saccostrea echinata TaxID=191078 RepID=UPI002A80B106|nr:pyruvate dehydrogenase (acetyl-transferring) kinase isozyme 2, mitochondrial-like isoform X2 [Saccostrea echinata]
MMKLRKWTFQCVFNARRLHSKYVPVPLSMQQYLEFGQKKCEKKSFQFLNDEIPIRLAHIMREFEDLPKELLTMKSVKLVRSWYDISFQEVQAFRDRDPDDEKVLQEFSTAIQNILNRHSYVVETMAQGVIEMEDTYGLDGRINERIQYFLDRFYMNRISIRMLLTQHAALFGNITNHPRRIGHIDPNCDVIECVKNAFLSARHICEHYHMQSPDLEIITADGSNAVHFVYVPGHIEHILFEIFKNAMRAVVEFHPDKIDLPKLKIIVSKGKSDMTIKLSDQGGGVPHKDTDKLFQYMYSTAPRPQYTGQESPLAGYGYGLPLSRLYARYFQGDLVVNSMEGYGTDVYLYLKVNSSEANECLPIYNTTTSRMYEAEKVVSDWSSNTNWSQSMRTYCTFVRKPPDVSENSKKSVQSFCRLIPPTTLC